MERNKTTSFVIVIALLALTALLLLWMGEAEPAEESAIVTSLPQRVNGYEGYAVWYCQNEQCRNTVLTADTGVTNQICPSCGAHLSELAPAEKRLLPADTTLIRKEYSKPGFAPILVAIVVSGRDRTSIHRPQMCLQGQGNRIIDARAAQVRLPNREPLKVMLLDVQDLHPRAQDGKEAQYYTYAYWFIEKESETPYHIERMLRTMYDNIIRGIAPRWAYVLVGTPRGESMEEDVTRLQSFISTLYPLIKKRDTHRE